MSSSGRPSGGLAHTACAFMEPIFSVSPARMIRVCEVGYAGFVYLLDALLGPNKADVGIGGANSIDRLDTGMVAVVVR